MYNIIEYFIFYDILIAEVITMRIRIRNTDDYEAFPQDYLMVLKKFGYKREIIDNKVFHYVEIFNLNEYIELYNGLMNVTDNNLFGLLLCDRNEEKEMCIEIYDEYRE